MLKVKLIDGGILPTIGHPGEDLGYDLYALHGGKIYAKDFVVLRTGVCAEFVLESEPELKFGFIVKERSSLAQQGVFILGGCIDSGYRGEIMLILANMGEVPFEVPDGGKVANLIPIPVTAKTVVEGDLSVSSRGEEGFGSTDGSKS